MREHSVDFARIFEREKFLNVVLKVCGRIRNDQDVPPEWSKYFLVCGTYCEGQ